MKFEPVKVIQVSYEGGSSKIPVGRLAYKDRKIFFEYFPEFLKSGLELSVRIGLLFWKNSYLLQI